MSKKVTIILIVFTIGFNAPLGIISVGNAVTDGQAKLTIDGSSSSSIRLLTLEFRESKNNQDNDYLSVFFKENKNQPEKFYGERFFLYDSKITTHLNKQTNRPRAPPIMS